MTILTAISLIIAVVLIAALIAAIHLLRQAGNVLDFADDLASTRLVNAVETRNEKNMTDSGWMRRCPAGHLLDEQTDLANRFNLDAVYCPVCSAWNNAKGTFNG